MFLGTYEYKVDNKGRLPLPPKFRQEFPDGLIATQGIETCIVVYQASVFQKGAGPLATEEIIENEKQRRLKRATFANAIHLTLDKQGRIALAVSLKEHAKIKDVAIIVGVGDRIELWNPELWYIEKLEAEGQSPENMESLKVQ